MCGICGVVGIHEPERIEANVRRMMNSLRHRGPDDEGILIAPPVGVGMTRLSIIDLPGGRQPVWNEAGTVTAVFNGEIYNFIGLRRQLESVGHVFGTRSDSEVIVHAYEEWGDSFPAQLRGMFAIALIECSQKRGGIVSRILLVRDRMGIKPLYYAYADGLLAFASELRALIAAGTVHARPSAEALSSYLLFGSVGEPNTFVEGVTSLPPGHFLEIRPQQQVPNLQPREYWRPKLAARSAQSRPNTGNSSPLLLRSLLEDALREHLIADVPLGVFLSSGIDSTALAALASRERAGIQSFTVAFPEQEFSEAEFARRTAHRLGTDHREFLLSGEETLERLDEAVAGFDQPSMDGINTYFVSWAARKAGLKVALSGLGGDELFGGYPTFQAVPRIAALMKIAGFVPRPVRQAVGAGIGKAPPWFTAPDRSRKVASACTEPGTLPHACFFARALFPISAVRSLMGEGAGEMRNSRWWRWLASAAKQAKETDSFTAVSWMELRSYMLNTLLRDTDGMSMAHSLEVRVPFLDQRLVEFALELPAREKRRRDAPKGLLMDALGDLLPPWVLDRPKRTFTFPWQTWLRGPLQAVVDASLRGWLPLLEPFVRGDSVRKVWKDFVDGRTNWSRPWSLYVLNEWAKQNLAGIEKESPKPCVAMSAV
jgi:asparagine synthase (glutamine-hydrolysing)